MRIDQGSPEPVPLPERTAGPAQSEGPDFGSLLLGFTREAPAPAPAASRELSPWIDLGAAQVEYLESHAELKAQRSELRAEQKELEEARRDAYLAGLEASDDQMDGLVDRWKERNPQDALNDRLQESEGKEEGVGEAEFAEIEGGDDVGEITSDFEELPLEAEEHHSGEGKGEGGGEGRGESGGGLFSEGSGNGNGIRERELSYQEIQALVETALNSSSHLPPRVRHVLQELLGALLDGQRWLLDQHRLIGLENDEWRLIQGLFPAHFYGGLLRQHRQGELPLYDMLQAIYEQIPPDQDRREQLLALWQPALGEPLLLRNWVLDQPLPAQPDELANLLELWQQHQALPPGATGRCLQLALAYRHHPEKMEALFLLAGDLLQGKELRPDQVSLLAACVSERCFQRELIDTVQIQALLEGVLTGAEPDEQQLHQLLAGCSQGVLSYLPYASLAPSLQDLQDYVRRDLLGHEDSVPGLLKE